MEFVAIDVETANPDMASICQIGLARYRGDQLVEEWSSLIDPEDEFASINTRIHGITASTVKGAPTFPEVAKELADFLRGGVSVSHTHFDRVSIARASNKYSLPEIETTWLDSAKVARRTWSECAYSGYGLAAVCKIIGYEFKHHDALEDAKAAGQILLSAMKETSLDLSEWLNRVTQPVGSANSLTLEGRPDGEFYGEVLVFTGSLQVPRSMAAEWAALAGCKVGSSVTKQTTLLVVGDQDILRLNGKPKSSKHLKAEKLINDGQPIRIIKESDFKELLQNNSSSF